MRLMPPDYDLRTDHDPRTSTVPFCRRSYVPRSALLLLIAASIGACSSSGEVGGASTIVPEVEGTYTVQMTYGKNGCEFDNWIEGDVLSGVVLDVRQDEEEIISTVEGLTGGVLALIHGSNIYEGSLTGNEFEMTIFGSFSQTEGNCTYTLNNHATGSFDGDFVQGRLEFVTQTNGNPDCDAVECSSVIAFNGTRPPTDAQSEASE